MERDERPLRQSPSTRPRRVVTGWSPGAIAAVVAGLFLAILGTLVLIDAGFGAGSFTSRTGTALSFTQTGLLAIVEIAFGVAVVWLAGDFPWYGRSAAIVAGVLATGFGIVLAAWATPFASVFGGDPASGWLWIGIGVVTIVSAVLPRRTVSPHTASTADLEGPQAPAKQVPWRRAG
jgi:hypothetical protein